ncbi:MAG: carboxyl transferase domain-containing protein [Actinomycetota bacterium]|nr:carboxyl transferase domain-containing protein [Actinomycetota bacterium]
MTDAADIDPRQQIITARARALAGCPTARKAIELLADPKSFTEYGLLAGRTTSVDDDSSSDGLVGGVCDIEGQPVIVAAHDRSVEEGTHSDRNMRKLAKLTTIAIANRWPLVLFIEGDGSRPSDPRPAPPIVNYTRARWDVLEGLTEMSGWAPTVALIIGPTRDSHSALAFLCDLVIATSSADLGSLIEPQMKLSPETAATRGDVDLVVEDLPQAVTATQRFLEYWHDASPEFSPADSASMIGQIVPGNRRRAYDMREVIEAFADRDSVFEVGSQRAQSLITVFARLEGRSVGIFANQPLSPRAGAIDSAAADKASRFVEWCDAYGLPLISFVDNPGYMVGPDAEQEGIARHHARPLSAIHHRTVPLYTVQIRKAYGLGPFAMSGYGTSRNMPELRVAWPTVESGGMSLEGAAYLVKRKEIRDAVDPVAARAIRDQYAEQMRDVASGVRAGRTFSFDDVILPEETRPLIASMLRRSTRALPLEKLHHIDTR